MTDGLTCEQVRDRESIERYVTGSLDELEADALEAHAMECAECWSALQQAVELKEALREPVAVERPSDKARSRGFRWALGLAAAAAVVLAVGSIWYSARFDRSERPIVRGSSGELTVTATWQAGDALRVEWTPASGAVLYRLQVSGSTGRELARTATESPELIQPADVALLGDVSILVEGENAAGEIVARSGIINVPRFPPR